ncbi:hypothetical protein [Streptomyces sp. NRRL F-5123]|uniref:hypothetical protein n=1 Tax=Streptomyces sp. NRRL F-5123 TaxID=1463856 RepID=UPI0006937360|nr:hypothetical protein [Streptomyces sp. NRRL F-5123]
MTSTEVRVICGERVGLPAALVGAARRLAPFASTVPEDVERQLRCTLERHSLGDHHAFVMELPGRAHGAVWTRWIRGRRPATVFVLPDCTGTGPPPACEPCCEFAAHPGAHSWELRDGKDFR